MEHSEHINEICTALAKAQAEMGAAVKDSTNPHFRSKYADLAAVVDAVRGPLSKHGISYTQWPEHDEGGVSVVTMLAHSSGQWMRASTFVPVSKADAQGYGSAITYAKRYGLQSACGVPSDDDDGNAAAKAAPIIPTTGAWEAMDTDQQAGLQKIAQEVIAMMAAKDMAGAAQHIEDQRLTADEKIALWTRFASFERTALKKEFERMKKETK